MATLLKEEHRAAAGSQGRRWQEDLARQGYPALLFCAAKDPGHDYLPLKEMTAIGTASLGLFFSRYKGGQVVASLLFG